MNEERKGGGNRKRQNEREEKWTNGVFTKRQNKLKGDSLPLPEKIENADAIARIFKVITNKQNYFGQEQFITTSPD